MTTINCPQRRDYDSQSSLKVWPVRSRFPKKRPCHFLPRPATFDPDPVPPTLEFRAQNAGRAVCFPGIEGKIIGDRELRLSEAGHRRTLRRDRSAEKLTHDCQPNSVRLARVFRGRPLLPLQVAPAIRRNGQCVPAVAERTRPLALQSGHHAAKENPSAPPGLLRTSLAAPAPLPGANFGDR